MNENKALALVYAKSVARGSFKGQAVKLGQLKDELMSMFSLSKVEAKKTAEKAMGVNY